MNPSALPPEPEQPEPEPVAEAIPGVRALRVRTDGTLLTVNNRVLAAEPTCPAICDTTLRGYRERDTGHEVPAWDCSCGFYALSSEHSRRLDPREWWAPVTLWGRVIEHENGWRAQYQRIDALCAPTSCRGCAQAASVLATGETSHGVLMGWCGKCTTAGLRRVEAPPKLLDDPRVHWGNVDPAGPPPPTLAAEIGKLTDAIASLGQLSGGVRPIPREVREWLGMGTSSEVQLYGMTSAYYSRLRIEPHQEGWRMLLLGPTGMIVWDTIIPYAKDPDRRFG